MALYPGYESTYRAGYHSSLFAALVAEGQAFGALVLMSHTPGHYDSREMTIAERVASQIGGAIAHAHRLHELIRTEDALHRSELEAKRLAAEEAVMANIGRIISSTLRIEEVYDQFAAEVRKILPFDRIAINLVDAEGQTVTTQYVAGLVVDGRGAGARFAYHGTATSAAFVLGPKGFSFDASLITRSSPNSRCNSSIGLPGT